MGKLLDYLNDFKNKTFAEAPFTEADNLALCQLAYCDLSRSATQLGQEDSVALPQAWQTYSHLREISGDSTALSPSEQVFKAMALSRRYAPVRLAWFDQRADESAHAQFAAYTALLPDGSAYLAFRGTDSRISAWRENFMMSYMVVTAQSLARRYVNTVGRLTRRRLRVGGHSKGGNLAAFAAASCSQRIKARIKEVWCNDSPGFVREVVDFAALSSIAPRTTLFIPEFCVVAGIMEQAFDPVVIRSSGSRYKQHDLMNWHVDEGRLTRSASVNPACHRVGQIFQWLIYSHSRTARVAIVNELFDALTRAGITRIYDFVGRGPSIAAHLGTQLRSCGRQTRAAVTGVLMPLARLEAGAALLRIYARGARSLAKALEPSHPVTPLPSKPLIEISPRN